MTRRTRHVRLPRAGTPWVKTFHPVQPFYARATCDQSAPRGASPVPERRGALGAVLSP